MNTRNRLRITTAILIAFATVPAFAADPVASGRSPVAFESFDKDGNGYVSPEEFNQMRNERIRSRAEEQRQFRNMTNAPGFSDMDADGDSKLNREEIQVHQRKRQEERNEYREQRHMDRSMDNTGMGMNRGGMGSGGGMGRR